MRYLLIFQNSNSNSLNGIENILRYDMHPQPSDLPLRLMPERVFSLVLQWEVQGRLPTLLPSPTDECDATVFAKGGAGQSGGDLCDSYKDLTLLAMIVDVASMNPGQGMRVLKIWKRFLNVLARIVGDILMNPRPMYGGVVHSFVCACVCDLHNSDFRVGFSIQNATTLMRWV